MAGVTSETTLLLITGANQGLGLAASKRLATEQQNYHIIMTGRRQQAIEEAAASLQKLGLSVEPLVMDVSSDDSITKAVQHVSDRYGRLDVLINNAGIGGTVSPDGVKREHFQEVYNTNVFGVTMVTEAFLPLLKKSTKTRRVVFVSSGLGSMQNKLDPTKMEHSVHYVAYSTSKSALNMLLLHYWQQYKDDSSWKFNLVCPGFCSTNLNSYAGTDTPEEGAVNICRKATLGADGESGTYSNRHDTIQW